MRMSRYRLDDHVLQQLKAIRAERLRGLQERAVDRARGVGHDQHHLEEGADEDDGDLGLVAQAEHGHGQGAEHRRRHVANEVHERLEKPRKQRERAAQDAQRQPQQSRIGEAPENDLAALPQALVQPVVALAQRRGRERRVERARDLVRSRQEHRVGALAASQLGVSLGELEVALLEHLQLHELVRGDIAVLTRHVHVAGVAHVHQRVPNERHVTDEAPGQQRQDERQHPRQHAQARW
jgi:hypothetical protein